MTDPQFEWIVKTMSRELTDFILEIVKNENVDYSDISELLEFEFIEKKEKEKLRNRQPATTNRCIARVLKQNEIHQCSHKAQEDTVLCKRHSKCDLKHGTINDELTGETKSLIKDTNKNTKSDDTQKIIIKNKFNINYIPKSINSFDKVSIINTICYLDKDTNCVYKLVEGNYYYIGNYNSIQKRIKYQN